MRKNKKIILAAILLALLIILSRFFIISTPIMKISFTFVAIALCATWLGPKWVVLITVVEDLIGATLFPSGSFFIGYTISAGLTGLIYGLLLYKKEPDSLTNKQYIIRVIIAVLFVTFVVIRVIIAVLFVTFVVHTGLNTLWTSITSGKAFMVLLLPRLTKQLIMIPIQIIVILFIERLLRKPFDKYIRSSDNDD